ncbi:MAG TPA: hypothetical protein VFV32_14740 [Acidimicrobiales bacterium]|nr:hypothetical protein [Acidimicrobiales bacterium]
MVPAEPAPDAVARPGPAGRHLWVVMLVVGAVTALWSGVAVGARATHGARTTADEPQYLLSALSLWEDHDLDITDELADGRYRDFHEVALPVQTEAVDGRLLSPHDPLLPALLAVPVGLAGWVGAKVALSLLAGALAALLVWTAVARLAVSVQAAAAVVLAFAVAAPLSAYGTQVYPELPAALAVTIAIAAVTGRLDRRGRWVLGAAVVALPWLGVKYVAVAAALAGVGVWSLVRRGGRRPAGTWLATLALAGVAFLVVHRAWYGGWTVYAAGDHFVGGELTVMGTSPDVLGRSSRLVGLLLDRGFGLAAWAPAYLLVVPALAALTRRRPAGALALAAPLAAGWATATWAALTMHGWWWPGRQVVVVVPCLVLAVAWWADRTATRRATHLVAALGAVGAALWMWLVVEVLRGQRTLVFSFESTTDPIYRAWRAVLPDYHHPTAATWLLQAAWLLALAALARWGWRRAELAPGAPTAADHSFQPQPRRYPDRVHA